MNLDTVSKLYPLFEICPVGQSVDLTFQVSAQIRTLSADFIFRALPIGDQNTQKVEKKERFLV